MLINENKFEKVILCTNFKVHLNITLEIQQRCAGASSAKLIYKSEMVTEGSWRNAWPMQTLQSQHTSYWRNYIYIYTHTYTHIRRVCSYTILESVLINLVVEKHANQLLHFWQHTPELQAKLIWSSDYGEY